jgi:Domain of unknown function (DUF362)
VHIAAEASAGATLDRLLDRARLIDVVERARAKAGKSAAGFAIAIKPTLASADPLDAALVERLATTLREHGYTAIAVVESPIGRNPEGEVARRAAAAGYSADGYRLADLYEERVPFDYGSVLGVATAGRTWVEADFRVSFARCATNRLCFYSASLANLFGCLPEPDKLRRYAGRGHEFYECCVLVADRLPVHFGVLDAPGGEMLASESLLPLDWVAGEKMALAPELNPIVHEALLRWGRLHVIRRGNVSPWQPWRNVRPATVVALDVLGPALRGLALRAGIGPFAGREGAWTVQ